MRQTHLEVIRKTDTNLELRLHPDGGSGFRSRAILMKDVEKLLKQAENYDRKSFSDAGQAMAALSQMGGKLYEWLDGPERWLETEFSLARNGLVLSVSSGDGLRGLPWEILWRKGEFLCANAVKPFSIVRRIEAPPAGRTEGPANRPMRVLMMACSPEDVAPVLDFENEEKLIIDATRRKGIDLQVEESGSLQGLSEKITDFSKGWFDVFHLTGHAGIVGGAPVFHAESEKGFRRDATARDIALCFQGRWPELVFLSGCRTGQSDPQGVLPSLCESLVAAGAPAVLGWALPVGDTAASVAAASIYERLASGGTIHEAVARARADMQGKQIPDWHLLRLFSDQGQPAALVTAPKTRGREKLSVRPAKPVFLDAGSKVEVCSREDFVGRRRALQRCLRALTAREGEEGHVQGVLLNGMGGAGKSSLALRLCDRMADYKRAVMVGSLEEKGFLAALADLLDAPEERRFLYEAQMPLKARLRKLLENGSLACKNLLFVFDDFENALDLQDDGTALLTPAAAEVLPALISALRESGSESKAIVTSRWVFPLPGPGRLFPEMLVEMKGADLKKKVGRLWELHKQALAGIPHGLVSRAVEVSAGNPRLLERLFLVLAQKGLDHAGIINGLEREEKKLREENLLQTLLGLQPLEGRKLLALLCVLELPVDGEAVGAIGMQDDWQELADRAAGLGLLEREPASEQWEDHFYVPRLIRPLLEGEATDRERVDACGRAARHLHKTWWEQTKKISENQALEIWRLAMTSREKEVAFSMADVISTRMVNRNLYRQAEELCRQTLVLGDDFRVLHELARAEEVLGKTGEALEHYERAKALCPAKEKKEYAAICNNLAGLSASLGNTAHALDLWEESLAIKNEIGDPHGKATTLGNMAEIIAQQGEVGRAMELWQESLKLEEQIGDVQGKAATLHNMAGVKAQQGETGRAMELWQESLRLLEQIGDVKGKAATLSNMAGVKAQQGETGRAMELWQESLRIKEQIGDVQGKAATLSNMAAVKAQQGEAGRAMELWQESLKLEEQIGDVRGKAAILHNMAGVIAMQREVGRAMELWQESLRLLEQIGDVRGKAATLAMMAWAADKEGDRDKAKTLNKEAALALASIGAWLDLVTVLSNLGAGEGPESPGFLAQALWACLRVDAPVDDCVKISVALHFKAGAESEMGPLIATAANYWAQTRGEKHPEKEKLQKYGLAMLAACAQERGIPPEQFQAWIKREKLNDPSYFIPKLSAALDAMVPEDQWLFDRGAFSKGQ
ncbi:MAG: tetratricopeptide repeat protein [Thermodesulfobacteriota bacterium]